MKRLAKPLALLVTIAALAAAPDAGAASPQERQYVNVLRQSYVPFRTAWLKTTVPCQREDFRACEARMRAADAAASRLLASLRKSTPPSRARAGDALLERGMRTIRAYVRKLLPALASRDSDRVTALGCSCLVTGDVVNAVGELNHVLGTDLPVLG